MPKQMGGGNRQRRKSARRARAAGKSPSAVGATGGANKQRSKAKRKLTHQQKVDLKREGKQPVTAAHTPAARPGSRDAETLDRERYPRLRGK